MERGFLIVYIMEQDGRIMKKFKMEIKGSDLEISAFFKGLQFSKCYKISRGWLCWGNAGY